MVRWHYHCDCFIPLLVPDASQASQTQFCGTVSNKMQHSWYWNVGEWVTCSFSHMEHSITHCVSQPSLLHLRTLSVWESTTIPHRHPFKASGICLGIHFCLGCLVSSEGLSSTASITSPWGRSWENLRLDKIRKYDIMLKYHWIQADLHVWELIRTESMQRLAFQDHFKRIL